jgi:hypothetical protein
MKIAHRLPNVGLSNVALSWARRPPPSHGIRSANTHRPVIPSSAGSRVNAMRTASSTVNAAASPICVRMGMSTTVSAVSATMTVRPAKVTAVPAVPRARPTASCWLCP